MQNDPQSPFGLPPSAFENAYKRAHGQACLTGEPRAGAESHDDTPDDGDGDGDGDGDDGEAERLLGGAELLHVVREPVEWLLALAHRLASSDPEDVAAVDRLRAAFHARLAGRSIGVRVTDALTAFGLLVSALDPSMVLQSVTRTIADGVSTLLAFESAALAAQLASLADASPATPVHHACVPRPRRGRTSRTHHTR
jgi:hypothetical protein